MEEMKNMDFELWLFENLPSNLYMDTKHMEWYYKSMKAAYNQALEDAAEKAKQVIQEDEDDSTIIIEILNLKKP